MQFSSVGSHKRFLNVLKCGCNESVSIHILYFNFETLKRSSFLSRIFFVVVLAIFVVKLAVVKLLLLLLLLLLLCVRQPDIVDQYWTENGQIRTIN